MKYKRISESDEKLKEETLEQRKDRELQMKKFKDHLKANNVQEEVELDERNKANAIMRKTMDAARGARYKLTNPVPPAEPEHKTAQAHNKAIGRALRNEDNDLEEAHQVVAKTKEGETFKSAVYPNKKQAMDMHYKMAKGNKYAKVDTVKVNEAEDWELKKIHGEYKHLKSLPTTDVLKKHKALRKVLASYTASEMGGKEGLVSDIMHHRHGQKRMDAYHSLSKKHKDNLSEQTSEFDLEEATGDKPFDSMMRKVTKAPTAKERNAERIRQKRERQEDSRKRAADAFGTNPASKLSIRTEDFELQESQIQKGDRVVADLRKDKKYPGTNKYRSGIVSRVGEKGVHIKTDMGEEEWHPHKVIKKLGTNSVKENQGDNMSTMDKYINAIKEGADFRNPVDEAKQPPFEGGVPAKAPVKDKSGAVHSPMSRVRDLARQAMKKQVKEEFGLELSDEQADDLVEAANTEQLDELSKGTLGSYVKKSSKDRAFRGMQMMSFTKDSNDYKDALRYAKNRQKGVEKAVDRLTKEEVDVEEFDLDEAMISYTDFHAKIAAHRKAGNDIADSHYGTKKAHYTVVDKEGTARKVTHSDAGSKMENLGKHKGEVEDESGQKVQKTVHEPAVKRGRGRPAGQTGIQYKPRDPASKAASAAKAAASKAANRAKKTK